MKKERDMQLLGASGWEHFQGNDFGDKFLDSVFKQAKFVHYAPSGRHLTIKLANTSPFFISKLKETVGMWAHGLRESFGGCDTSVLHTLYFDGAPLLTAIEVDKKSETGMKKTEKEKEKEKQFDADVVELISALNVLKTFPSDLISKVTNTYTLQETQEDSAKLKATFCLDVESSKKLDEIYIKRLNSGNKSTRSALICDAISLLHGKELYERKD